MMKILYVKNGDSSFLRIDEEILKKNFNTRVIGLKITGPFLYFLQLLRLIALLFVLLPLRSVAYTRFADWHSAILAFFCRLYGKKLVIVVGGYDASWFPEHNYGVYNRKTRGRWARYALRNASILLPLTPSLIRNVNTYIPGISRDGGIDYFVPDRKGSIEVVYNGYHTDFWTYSDMRKDPLLIITVAFISNFRSFKMKGIDDFIDAARHLPDLKFKLIGSEKKTIGNFCDHLPANLEIIPSLSREELREEYRKARVFCLLSLSEGMPNVLCEAMLCNCIPVVSDVSFNAELVGDSGIVIRQKNIAVILDSIRKAVRLPESEGNKAGRRIREFYPFDLREKQIVHLLEGIHSR